MGPSAKTLIDLARSLLARSLPLRSRLVGLSASVILAVGCVNLTPPWAARTDGADDGMPVSSGVGGVGGVSEGSPVGGAAGFIDSVWPGLDGGGATQPGAGGSGGSGGVGAPLPGAGGRDASSVFGSGGATPDANATAMGGAAGWLSAAGLGGFVIISDDGGSGGVTGSSNEAPDGAWPSDGRVGEPTVDAGLDIGDGAAGTEAATLLDGGPAPASDLAADLPSPIPTSGLIAYYPCDSVAAGTLADESGAGNDATLTGDSRFVQGQVGRALLLTAQNDGDAGHTGTYLTLPAGLLAGATGMTFAAWFNAAGTGGFQRVFDFGTSSTVSSMYFTPANGNGVPQFTIRQVADGPDLKQTVLGPELETGVWHFVVATLDAAAMRLYLDGVEVASTTTVKLTTLDLGAMPNNWIGRSEFPADPYFDGTIDEIRVYDRALSADEAAALFAAR
jgi:hypothetical protein